MSKKILVTAALPYANGSIHIGHLVEYLQADIWSRYQKMRGRDCIYLCASDTHGTPIMIQARKRNIEPEELIDEAQKEHLKDFNDFEIEFDHFSSTNSDSNKELCEQFFADMDKNQHLDRRSISQSYCEHDGMFLPDRFVKGTCPKCGAKGQYGDSCDICSATYSPMEMKDSECSLCGNPPGKRDSEHVFFKLDNFRDFLQGWVKEHVPGVVVNKLNEWLADGLHDWDISRDKPYFGFKIPGYEDKFFYVWVDAPMGYISTTKEFCKKNGGDFKDYWNEDADSEIYHFIGKDIINFHTLFWPAMLKNSKIKTPDRVFVHGMLTVDGEKMSKSKGTFIKARTYLNHLNPMHLRYYYASKLSDGVDDLDLNFEDFTNRVNSDLIGKITNMASRGAQMLHKKIDGRMGQLSDEGRSLVEKSQQRGEAISGYYEGREYNKAMIEIREIAEDANKYFDEKEPWKLIKEDIEQTREVLTTALNLFRLMAIYLTPVLPKYSENVAKLFVEDVYSWKSSKTVLENQEIQPYVHLASRVDKDSIEKIVEESQKEFQ